MLFKFLKMMMSFLSLFLGIKLNLLPTFSGLDLLNKQIEKENIATLAIPAISLEQDLYAKDDERSNIDERLVFLSSSSSPEKEKGNVIIAGHSGFGDIAYFKNLYRLKLGDNIFLTYNNKQYRYQIVDMYKVPKTGKIELVRDSNKKTITLITCYGNKEQLVIIGEQKSNT